MLGPQGCMTMCSETVLGLRGTIGREYPTWHDAACWQTMTNRNFTRKDGRR